MRRLLAVLMGLWLAVSSAMAGVNTTLTTAQEMLSNAHTLDEYQKTKKKFQTAKSDPAYNPAEHDNAIEDGINTCNSKIAQFSAKITVNGSVTPSVGFAAEGGRLTLDVHTTKGGSVKAKSNASWLTVESVGKDSVAVRCEPNDGKEQRTATLTVSSGGSSVKVNVKQEFVEFVISDILIGSTDSNGNEVVRPGMPLATEQVLYLVPQFKLSGLAAPVTKKVCTRLIRPDKVMVESVTSPDGYTDGKEISLWPGENTISFPGWGSDVPGVWPEGTYKFEVWVNDKKEAEKHFRIISRGLTVWKVDFAAADKKGQLASAYGQPVYEEDARTIKPRITYCGANDQYYTLDVNFYRLDGTLDRNKKSPAGCSYSTQVQLKPGTNVIDLRAWGSGKKGAFPEGTYRFEILSDGKLLYSTKIYVASKRNPLRIDGVEYAATDKGGTVLTDYGSALKANELQYLQPRISYSGMTKPIDKTVIVKIYRPDGSMVGQPKAPDWCSYSCRATFKPGDNSATLAAYGSAEADTFAHGTYKIEYWVDGMLMFTDSITIN